MEGNPREKGRAGPGSLWFGMGGGAQASVTRQAGAMSAARETGRRVWKRGLVEATAGMGEEAGGGAEQPGSLVQVPTLPLNLCAALGKVLNHSEPVHVA